MSANRGEQSVSLGVTASENVKSPAFFDILDRNYRYKLLASLILHGSCLVPVPTLPSKIESAPCPIVENNSLNPPDIEAGTILINILINMKVNSR